MMNANEIREAGHRWRDACLDATEAVLNLRSAMNAGSQFSRAESRLIEIARKDLARSRRNAQEIDT